MQSNVPLTPMILDSSTAIKLTMGTMGSHMYKEKALMARNDAWHRIEIIRGARYDKEIILRTILKAVEPADLIPVRYQVNGENAYFMARNCGSALETLCRSNLIINLPNDDPIVIIVTLAFASIHDLKINIQPILLSALTRRYNKAIKYLSLENFHSDPDIAKTVYCPLSQSKTLGHTLKLAKTALGPFEYLNLQHNDLTTLAALENSNLVSLRGLDIRHNYLLTMDVLASLKSLTITEIWLDGNPLCENYANPRRYVESVKRYCPNLRKIDGLTLDEPELPLSRENYHRNDSESRKIVEQFLTHFYDIYDRKDRLLLVDLYHKNAIYSQTLGISLNTLNRHILDPFANENRNLLDSTCFAKNRELLYHGNEIIVGTFKKLPDTLHDRSSFRCDIMHEDYRRILVSVKGIFRARINHYDSSILAFSRTFLLVGRDDNEYVILNDQSHVDTALPATTIFRENDNTTVNDNGDDNNESRDSSFSPREKERMIYTLMDVTTMNTEWCHRFLNDANWNARRAIKNFMDNYKSSNIPIEAFSR